MKVLFFRGLGVFALFSLLFGMLSCAHDQQLVSISIAPSAQEFGDQDPALNVQLRALGNYIHPPVTKDITDQVTWASDSPIVAVVSSTGLLSPSGFACGGALISATVQTNSSAGNRTSKGAIITSTIVTTVDNPLVMGCPGFQGTASQPALTVDFAGAGTGTVSSSPSGLGCATSCSATFPANTSVTLTATPTAPSTFGSWVGCDIFQGTMCTVNLTTSRTVTVTFNP
jgi:hypothetical protein